MILTPFLALPSRIRRDFRRLIRNNHFEWDDHGGLLLSGAHFTNHIEHWAPDGQGWLSSGNLLTTEGKNHILDTVLHDGVKVGTWYIAPFSGNVSPAITWTAANFNANATELSTQYSETTRVEYVEGAASAGVTNNNANPAWITAAVANVSVWGIGVLSTNTKQGTTGVLLAAAKYGSVRTLAEIGDQLGLKYQLSLT